MPMSLGIKILMIKWTIQKTKKQDVYYGQDSQSSSKVFFVVVESLFDSEVSDGCVPGSSVFDIEVASRSVSSNSRSQLSPDTEKSNIPSSLFFS